MDSSRRESTNQEDINNSLVFGDEANGTSDRRDINPKDESLKLTPGDMDASPFAIPNRYAKNDTQIDIDDTRVIEEIEGQIVIGTQRLMDDTQMIIGDTQGISSDTQKIINDTQKINYHQIPNSDDINNFDTQVIHDMNSEGFVNSSIKGSSPDVPMDFDINETIVNDPVQIPGTVEKDKLKDSETQVMNTQEAQMPAKLVLDECVISDDDSELYYDDTLMTHRRSFSGKLQDSTSTDKNKDFNNWGGLTKTRRKRRISDSSTETSIKHQSTLEILRSEQGKVIDTSMVVSSKSVWASHQFKMYTGKVQAVYKHTLKVLFEEGVSEIDNSNLYPLDIRIGDLVKVKTSTTMYKVVGLSYQDTQHDIVCIRGYNVVHLKRLAKTKKVKYQDEITVSLQELIMELPEWYQHQQEFKVDFSADNSLSNIINNNMKTPTRTRQTQELANPSKNDLKQLQIFRDCLFCISGIDDTSKTNLVELIYQNGGDVLSNGFINLFVYQQAKLKLADEKFTRYKFVALISNGYYRSSKYLQTVALGWPILSERFIYDFSRDSRRITHDNWVPYLLSAGYSSILGTEKSLNVFSFKQGYDNNWNLSQQLNLHGHLLKDFTILAIDNGDNREELNTCEFIFHAFGVDQFVIVDDIEKYIKEKNSPNVLVYTNKGHSHLELNVVDWEWVVQCCISSYIWPFVK